MTFTLTVWRIKKRKMITSTSKKSMWCQDRIRRTIMVSNCKLKSKKLQDQLMYLLGIINRKGIIISTLRKMKIAWSILSRRKTMPLKYSRLLLIQDNNHLIWIHWFLVPRLEVVRRSHSCSFRSRNLRRSKSRKELIICHWNQEHWKEITSWWRVPHLPRLISSPDKSKTPVVGEVKETPWLIQVKEEAEELSMEGWWGMILVLHLWMNQKLLWCWGVERNSR